MYFSKQSILRSFYLSVTLIVIFSLFYKCKYGYATLDEAFYPTIAKRFLQGDRILFDEWNNTQLSALVIMPFLKIYSLFHHDYSGVYLYFRYAYTVIKILITFLLFFNLRRFGEFKAYVVSLIFLIYCCYGLMVISYNSIAIFGILLWIICLFCAPKSKYRFIRYIIGGVCLSAACLGIPYLAGLFLLYCLGVIVVSNKNLALPHEVKLFYSYKALLGVTVGIFVPLTFFIIFVFSHISLSQLINTLPHILMGDPDHPVNTLYKYTIGYFSAILLGHGGMVMFDSESTQIYVKLTSILIYTVYFLLFITYFFIRRKTSDVKKISSLFTITSIGFGIVLIIFYIKFFVADVHLNNLIFVPNVIALTVVFYKYFDVRIQRMFFIYYIPGMILTYFEYIASNTGFSGISGFSCVASIGSLLIILFSYDSIKNDFKYFKYIITIFYVILIASTFYYRMIIVFWEGVGLNQFTKQIDKGVAKGLLVTENRLKKYNEILDDANNIKNDPESANALIIDDKVLWMELPLRCASYSPLNYSISKSRDILYNYYKIHEEKIPDIIYVGFSNINNQQMAKELSIFFNFDLKKGRAGWILKPKR